jgi:glycosyltransferase 2 family protein
MLDRRSALLRLLVGVVISAAFLAVTLVNVDLGKAADAIGHAAPLGLLAAVLIVLVDLSIRALRWHVLLRNVDDGAVPPPYRLAFGYLTIGFAANFVLPARLGDVARAVVAADTFKAPRLSIFGTVLIERVSDGLTFLVLAILSSLVVASTSQLRELTGYAVALTVAGLAAGVIGWIAITRTALSSTRVGGVVLAVVRRLSAGGGAFRHLGSAAAFLGLTALLATTASLVAWTVLQAVGVQLSPVQAVLFLSGIALSLAIPAAPGAIGTYEFVGVAIVTGLGYTPAQGLATILLMRIITTFPPALIGLVSIWALHVRPSTIGAAETASLGGAETP